MGAKIAVFGSVNMDLVARVERFPRPGETIRGLSFSRIPGGKGANQAVAAAKLGGEVSFYGLVGDDGIATDLSHNLRDHGVDISGVQTRRGPSGLALIQVNEGGENQIVIVSGANGKVDREYVDSHIAEIREAEVLLLQLEVPAETIAYLLRRLEETAAEKPEVILDPAPVGDIWKFPLSSIDALIPNEGELRSLLSDHNSGRTVDNLLEREVTRVIVTRGKDGCTHYGADGRSAFSAFSVQPVDTTAAGDAFAGGLAVALGEGKTIEESIPFASAAGAISTTREGAQPSLPGRDEVLEFLKGETNYEVSTTFFTGETDEQKKQKQDL